MLIVVYGLIIAAVVCFVTGAVTHFVGRHEGTVWWRGAVGLLAFAQTFLLLGILQNFGGFR